MPVTDMGSYFPTNATLKPAGPSSALRLLYATESTADVTALIQHLGARTHWEVAHAATAGAALELVRNQPLEICLLNASLPETQILDLAATITQLRPKITIFIIASEAISEEQAHSSGRYQWIPKSVDLDVLISAIERMASLVSWLSNNTTIELVSGIQELPTIPSNYQGVLRIIHSAHSSIQDIGDAVEKDMGMTSRVLQIANSAYYGYSQKITNPTEAAQLLGVEALKSLVRYTHVLNNFPQSPPAHAVFELVWRHSLGVAAIARRITMLETNDETRAEAAFTAGLLHDIGKLILVSLKPDQYKEAIRESAESKIPIHVLERVKLGTTHAETGGYLLSLWGIPLPILEAVAWHHFPSECKEKKFSALTAVHIANHSYHLRTNRDNIKAVPPLDERYLADVGVTSKLKDWLEISPDQARRNEPVGQPYIVRPAPPAPPPEVTPTWVWILLAMAGISVVAMLWFFFSEN